MANKPLNISIMDVEAFIRQHNCQKVSSTFIYEPSSREFAKDGLFSEDIFGQIGSPDRLVKFGYIDLRTVVFHPVVYSNLVSLKAMYSDLLSRKVYAKFDPTIGDFVRCEEDEDGANTGFKFFMDNYKKIKFVKNNSVAQNDKITLLNNAKELAFIKQCLVMPAQIRDVDPSSTRLDPDSINKLYISLINYANALPQSGVVSAIYDGIRFSIQKKVVEIYNYIFNMIEGKFGFFQRKYGSRNLALGTRNVISPAPLNAASTDAGNQLKCDELGVPLFEAAKAAMPLVIYHAKTDFFNSIFSQSNDQVTLIDPKTYDLVYKPIDEEEKNKFISSDGIEKLTNLFRDREFRFKPMTCKTEDGKYFYLFLVYDEGNRIQLTRSISSLRNYLANKHRMFKPQCLRPITYAEFFYIVTYLATKGKHCVVTRYPSQQWGSTVPCRIHLMSTRPSRDVEMYIGDSDISVDLPEYPVLGKGFQDSISMHAGIMRDTGSDFDGNCVTGDSTVIIRYTKDWLFWVKANAVDAYSKIASQVILNDDEYEYAKICIKDFPQIGDFKYDKNHAKVYSVRQGCWVESYNAIENKRTFEAITSVTIEDCCDVIHCALRSKHIDVSPNESLAVFDHYSGLLTRVTPEVAKDLKLFIPVMKTSYTYGNKYTFDDGWIYGALASDGFCSEKGLGYTKLSDVHRDRVKRYLDNVISDSTFHEYHESKSNNKLGDSITLRYNGASAKSYFKSLDLYHDDIHDALHKQISIDTIDSGSKEFLYGILCGLIDGDGSFVYSLNRYHIAINTSSIYLVNSIKHLCYKLGLRISVTTMPPRNWSARAYVVCISLVDFYDQIDHMRFTTQEYNNLVECLKKQDRPVDNRDIIPISEVERVYLLSLFKKLGVPFNINNLHVTRGLLNKHGITDNIEKEFSSLKERILNKDIHWETIRYITNIGKQPVYDFLVDSTKVFVINDGVVVYDTVSMSILLSDEANNECSEHINSVIRWLSSSGQAHSGLTYLEALPLYNLTR